MVLRSEKISNSSAASMISSIENHVGLEQKSGHLFMKPSINSPVRTQFSVFVRVYKGAFEHYAVIFKSETTTNNYMFVNLKQCVVEQEKDMLRINSNSNEGMHMSLCARSVSDANEWRNVLSSRNKTTEKHLYCNVPSIQRQSLMPILQETEDDS